MTKTRNHSNSFDSGVKRISQILCDYSVQDIVTALFGSSIWLPNIASPVKHQLLYAILASTEANMFSKNNMISSYEDFEALLKKVYPLLPSFLWIEDYVPEADWGDVKFHHEEADYKVFYGSEISNVYDYLMLFQMLYASLDKEYVKHTARSPSGELRQCLMLQDEIISEITTRPSGQESKQLSPGHIEVPPSSSWEEVSAFYSRYRPEHRVTKSFLDRYSFDSGSLSAKFLEQEALGEAAFSGSLLPYFFLKHNDSYFPILPRRYSAILLDSWSKEFARHHKEIDKENSYFLHLNSEVYDFLKKRIGSKSLFPFVSAVTKQESPHEILFAASFISKDRLVLVYVPAPFHSGKQMGEELSKITPKLKEAVELISMSPVTLGLHSRKQIVRYDPDANGENLKPEVFVVLAQTSTQVQRILLPEELPGRILFLDQFLGIIDEVDEVEEVAAFIEYLEEIDSKTKMPLISMLDKFGSFKSSYGVLVEGAREPDLIILHPHWGSNMRYDTLAEFWKRYPESGFFDHPRSWRIEQVSDKGIRLEARGYFGSALCCRVGSSYFFTNAPFHVMSYRQGQITNMLMECLEDSISRNGSILGKHTFFDIHRQFQVSFFPYSLVRKNDDFGHLRHLDPGDSFWQTDIGFVKHGVPGVRVVFDERSLTEALEKVEDSTLEIDLLAEILNKLNGFAPDPKLSSILSELSKQRSNKPRFKLFKLQKEVSFPEFVSVYEPSLHYHKKAGKIVAELAEQAGLSPGSYELKEAQERLNTLRKKVVAEIDDEVSKHKFEDVIPYLIERVDALSHEHEYKSSTIKRSLEHDVDYDRYEQYAEVHREYVRQHKNFRYLIEKSVQLQPSGDTPFGKDRFQYLVALVDKLHEIYTASDSIHYEIYPVGISVNDDYVILVEYGVDLETMQKTYGKERAELELGLIGNEEDRVDSTRPVEDYLDELNSAFKDDLGFGLRSMVNVLQILSQWPGYQPRVQDSSYYSAEENEISEICSKNIENVNVSEIGPILDFLCLKSQDVVRILDQVEPCDDLPVWEHRKRYSRYTLRPLILLKGKYFWGPHSARRAGTVWSNVPVVGMLPTDLQSSAIQRVIEEEKKNIEAALVDKTLEIVKRFTQQAEPNVKLHTRDREGNHPEELGDYDVLAFYPDKNVVLNIENKDILPAFCLKDTKRIRERIFGRPGKDQGYLERVEKRGAYLADHLVEIARVFKWSMDSHNLPEVISLFVSRRYYWWTRFPPRSTKVEFLRIDLLSRFLEEL